MYAHKGGTKKLKRHGLHGFALDQPSINGIGPINRSEKVKRSETVGNGRTHDQAKTCSTRIFFLNKHFRATPFFFLKVQRCPRGNGWKQSEIAPSLGKKVSSCFYTISNIFHEHMLQNNYFFAEWRCDLRLFPTVSPWTPLDLHKKKRRCAEMLILNKTTVSDRFTFSERLIGLIPFMEGWSSANPCKPWRLSCLVPPLCAYTAPNIEYCILTLISNIP